MGRSRFGPILQDCDPLGSWYVFLVACAYRVGLIGSYCYDKICELRRIAALPDRYVFIAL